MVKHFFPKKRGRWQCAPRFSGHFCLVKGCLFHASNLSRDQEGHSGMSKHKVLSHKPPGMYSKYPAHSKDDRTNAMEGNRCIKLIKLHLPLGMESYSKCRSFSIAQGIIYVGFVSCLSPLKKNKAFFALRVCCLFGSADDS